MKILIHLCSVLTLILGFMGEPAQAAKTSPARDLLATEVRALMLQATNPELSNVTRTLATEKIIAHFEIQQALNALLQNKKATTKKALRLQTWRNLLIEGLSSGLPNEGDRLRRTLRSPDVIVQQQTLKNVIENQKQKLSGNVSLLQPLEAAKYGLEIEELTQTIEKIYLKSSRIRPALLYAAENSELSRPLIRSLLNEMNELSAKP